jgi:hypothetical protein
MISLAIGWCQIILTLLEVFNLLACRKKKTHSNAHEYLEYHAPLTQYKSNPCYHAETMFVGL